MSLENRPMIRKLSRQPLLPRPPVTPVPILPVSQVPRQVRSVPTQTTKIDDDNIQEFVNV